MTVRIACGLSTAPDPHAGALEAAATVASELHGCGVDLAVVFASGAHLAAPEATIGGVHDVLAPDVLIGCGAGGIVGGGREIERGTAVAVWAASFEDGVVSTFHAEAHEVPDGLAVSGVPDLRGAGGAIVLPDPYSFPTDAVLTELHQRSPGVPVLGGVSSARTLRGDAALFLGEEVVSGGAVGVRFDGVELLPCVSQGATPIGPELTITAGEGRTIHELAGRPALAALRSVIEELGDEQRRILAEGMLLGIVVERGPWGGGSDPHGDFLVRSVLGGDPETGTISVGAPIMDRLFTSYVREGPFVRVQHAGPSLAMRWYAAVRTARALSERIGRSPGKRTVSGPPAAPTSRTSFQRQCRGNLAAVRI